MIIKNCTYLDWETFAITDCDLLVPEEKTGGIEILSRSSPEYENETVFNAGGKIVTKSFGCAHQHIYSMLARGMPSPKAAPSNFHEVLKKVWWVLDRSLDLDMIRSSAEVAACLLIKNGVTSVIDHHASPFAVKGSLHTIADVFEKAGLNYVLCYEISDRDGEKIAEQGLIETEEYLTSGRAGLVGLHASFTVNDPLLKQAVDLMKKYNSGIHIHSAEDRYDQVHCEKEYNTSVIRRLAESGALDSPKTILVHCLHIDKNERKIIKESPCWIAQNPDSNLNNKVGFFNGTDLGENIMLGTDGMHCNMIASAQTAFFSADTKEAPSLQTVYKRLRAVHRYLDSGNFIGNSDNNLMILNYNSPTELTENNFLGHFFYALENRHIHSLISDGKLIYNSGTIETLDEKSILSEAKIQADKLWNKMNDIGEHV